MAKVGKDKVDVDPFSAGNKAFGALGDALGALDAPTPSGHTTPEVKRADDAPQTTARETQAVPESASPARKRNARSSRGESKKKPVVSKPMAAPADKRARRFLATDEEMASWQRAAMRLGATTGARIDFSKMTRALWEIYLRHEEDIVRNIPEDRRWERPANADTVGLAALDDQLANLLNEGLMVASRRPKNTRRSED